MLTNKQAEQLTIELLGDAEELEVLPESARRIVIGESGAGRSMTPEMSHCEPGSIREGESDVVGAEGRFKAKFRGDLALPIQSNKGVGLFKEKQVIINTLCPYVLLSLGRASIEQGIRLHMPGWGEDGYFVYPNGVKVTLLNKMVFVVQPIQRTG